MHRCVRCGRTYEDNDAELIRGCRICGGIFFLYMKDSSDAGVRQLDAVKQELEAKNTTIENELAKEIEKRKAEGMWYAAAEASGKAGEEAAGRAGTAGSHVEFETVVRTKPSAMARRKRRPRPARKKAAKTKPARRVIVRIGTKRFALDDIFGIETVRAPNEGVYEINIDALMKKRPVIVLERGGIYVIHLPEVFQSESSKD